MKQQQSPSGVSDTLSGITSGIKRLGRLYIEKARLKTSEKLTILLSTIAFVAVLVALFLILMVFVSIGIGHLLATSIAPHLAYLFVAAFYLIILVIVAILRKPLFINPIARFISRLLVDAPDDEVSVAETHGAENDPSQDLSPEIDYDKLAEHILKNLEKKNTAEQESFQPDITDTDTTDTDTEGGEL